MYEELYEAPRCSEDQTRVKFVQDVKCLMNMNMIFILLNTRAKKANVLFPLREISAISLVIVEAPEVCTDKVT